MRARQREEKNQGDKIRECRPRGLAWQLTSSCPAQAQSFSLNKLEIMTLSLVFERARELNKDEKFTRGEKSDEPSGVNCSICFGLSHGTEGTKETQLAKGPVFHTLRFFSPPKVKKGESRLTAKLPYRSLFNPLLFLPPS